MSEERLIRCFVSIGIALLFVSCLGLIGIGISSSTQILAKGGGTPRDTLADLTSFPNFEPSSRSAATATIYFPLVLNNYPLCESPPLNWASDLGGVFLRWRWPEGCAGPATFRVYRTSLGGTPTLLDDAVAPVTDPA